MGSISIWHWLAVAVVGVLVFGGGSRITNIMGDAAQGIKAFRDGLVGEPDGPGDRGGE